MSNHMEYLTSSDNEYILHNIKQKIEGIISPQEDISAEEIKRKVDTFPNALNIDLLKNSVQLLHKNNCLTKENLALIGNEENFSISYFVNGILKKLDDANLIKQDNIEWILKNSSNQLYWNIAVLHESSQLLPETLQALKDKKISDTFSDCFENILLPSSRTRSLASKHLI